MLIDTLHALDLFTGNVLEHLQFVALVVLEAVGAQIDSGLQAFVNVDQFVVGAIVADLGLVHDLSGKAILDQSAGLAHVGIRDAVDGPQEITLRYIGQFVQILLGELGIRVDLARGVSELHVGLFLFEEDTRGTRRGAMLQRRGSMLHI